MSFLAGLPGLLMSPQGLNLGIGGMAAIQQLLQQIIATSANEGRYTEGKDLLTAQRDQTSTALGDLNKFITGRLEQNLAETPGAWDKMREDATGANSDMAQTRSRVLGALQDRYRRNMDYLEGSGAQERRDINQSFDAQEAGIRNDLVRRGFGNTTALQSSLQSSNRQRSDALGGLMERLRAQRIGTDTSLSGDVINADTSLSNQLASIRQGYQQQGYNAQQANLSNTLNNIYSMGTNSLTSNQNATSNLVNWIGGRQDTYPDQNIFAQFQQQLGAGRAPAVQYPSPDFLGPSIGAAGTATGLITAATIIAPGFCVDVNSSVFTDRGEKRLEDVREGDMVQAGSADGKRGGIMRKVLFIDWCDPHPEKADEYMEIVTVSRGIRLSRDHIIGGKAARLWKVGDYMPTTDGVDELVVGTGRVKPFRATDMILEHASTYVCNGFIVSSMFPHYGESLADVRAKRESLFSKG